MDKKWQRTLDCITFATNLRTILIIYKDFDCVKISSKLNLNSSLLPNPMDQIEHL